MRPSIMRAVCGAVKKSPMALPFFSLEKDSVNSLKLGVKTKDAAKPVKSLNMNISTYLFMKPVKQVIKPIATSTILISLMFSIRSATTPAGICIKAYVMNGAVIRRPDIVFVRPRGPSAKGIKIAQLTRDRWLERNANQHRIKTLDVF